MYPIITAAAAEDHRDDLLRQAAQAHRVQLAFNASRRNAARTPARRAVRRPLIAVSGWLARGFL